MYSPSVSFILLNAGPTSAIKTARILTGSDTAIHSAPSANCYFFTKWKIVSVPIKRLRVATELLELLETDQVLRREAFEDIPAQLVTLLDRDLLVDPTRSPVEKRPRLICSLCVQLADITEASYITEALEMLEQELFAWPPLDEHHARDIYSLTNGG